MAYNPYYRSSCARRAQEGQKLIWGLDAVGAGQKECS